MNPNLKSGCGICNCGLISYLLRGRMSQNELHTIGVTEEFRGQIEKVDPRFVREGILRARDRSWKVLHEIWKLLHEGLTELEARRLALDVFASHGVKKHWHQPNIRFGPGTAQTFHDPLQPDYRLRANDAVAMDLGPVWPDDETGLEYEGDVGDSFVFGTDLDAEKCVEAARTLFEEGKKKWAANPGITGKALYEYLTIRASEEGYRLLENVVGHRASDFPHQKYCKEKLPKMEFHPSRYLWVLELQIVHPTRPLGAFYEDLLF
jgi:CDP-4-dehydro-6-deoxyglucose reductase